LIVTYFRCSHGVEDLARAWNTTGPYHWVIRESYDRGDYLKALVGENKVRIYCDPPRYEIDVLTPVGTSKETELADRLALDETFRTILFPQVGATEE
jgi:hypothetical protein